MLDITYTVSPELASALKSVDEHRRNILLTPLSPKYSMVLSWDSMCGRIFHAHTLTGQAITKQEVANILSGRTKDKSKPNVLAYKRVFDYIKQEWLVNDSPLTEDVLISLHRNYYRGRNQFLSRKVLDRASEDFKYLNDYWQNSSENPVVQAGIVHMTILKMAPFAKNNEIAATLFAYLFLYKLGYDVKGFLVIEEFLANNREDYKDAVEQSLSYGNLTAWLTFFASGIADQLEKVERMISVQETTFHLTSSYWKLNDRQKAILAYFIKPDTKITNRKVQKQFEVSQITASRDLAKLARLGLLFTHGKGRSVFYTNVWSD